METASSEKALPEMLKTSETDSEDKKDKPDLYSYTKLNDFTSEIFKIELCNLPSFVGYGQLRKLLNSTMQLNPRKVKAIGNPPTFAFITFKNEEDRDRALKKLNGHLWRGKTLCAKLASPARDPMAQKRLDGDSEDCPNPKRRKDDDTPVELRLKNAVTPFWDVPYEEQLQRKQEDVHKFLRRLGSGIEKVNKEFKDLIRFERRQHSFRCCRMNDIIRSPVKTGYRNKCEFTCGRHLLTKERTVGFRLNAYKEGSMSVAEPDDCVNIGEPMLKAVKSFQTYIRGSELDVYNPENHGGYWRQLTVRTSNNSDVLLIVVMHPQSLSKEELDQEKLKLKEYFEEGLGSTYGITSVYVQLFSKKGTHDEKQQLAHLMGKKFVEETCLGMKFQVSPEAFFQINVSAAEILYQLVSDLVQATPNATALDVCCGTGTISLCLAKAGLQVYGIEMCPEAVDNARLNAKLANLSNVEFVCGKAEDVIIPTLQKITNPNVVAVVDPPRAGLHQKVLKAIRACPQISQLVYVSCNPHAAYTNFVDLCRAPSNNYKGKAFYPVRADIVDLFPYTPHKELVLLFRRSNDLDLNPKDKETTELEPVSKKIKLDDSSNDSKMNTESCDAEVKTESSNEKVKIEAFGEVQMDTESHDDAEIQTTGDQAITVEKTGD